MMLPAAEALADGEIKNLKDFQYWDSGKVKECDVYDAATGRLKEKFFCAPEGTIERVDRYDGYGNKVESALYDGKGRLKGGIDGWAAMRWRYDGSKLVWQVAYDEDGRAIERKLYTESGRLAMRMYRDDDSVNPYVNAAMYTMLGGGNMAYYDSRKTLQDVTKTMNE